MDTRALSLPFPLSPPEGMATHSSDSSNPPRSWSNASRPSDGLTLKPKVSAPGVPPDDSDMGLKPAISWYLYQRREHRLAPRTLLLGARQRGCDEVGGWALWHGLWVESVGVCVFVRRRGAVRVAHSFSPQVSPSGRQPLAALDAGGERAEATRPGPSEREHTHSTAHAQHTAERPRRPTVGNQRFAMQAQRRNRPSFDPSCGRGAADKEGAGPSIFDG